MSRRDQVLRAVVVGGSGAAILDGLDAIFAFGLVLHLTPTQIYQFVASGILGPEAFDGGLSTALLGVLVHCLVACSAAGVFAVASLKLPWLHERAGLSGSLFGVGVYAFMNYVVIPLSLIPPSPFSLPLFVNGVVGHALFVGLPIAYATRHYLGAGRTRPSTVAHPQEG